MIGTQQYLQPQQKAVVGTQMLIQGIHDARNLL